MPRNSNDNTTENEIRDKFNLTERFNPQYSTDNGGYWHTETNPYKLSFNDFGVGGGAGQSRNVIVYYSNDSSKFIVRKYKMSNS